MKRLAGLAVIGVAAFVACAPARAADEFASRAYDQEIGMLEDDGHFDAEAVAVLKKSCVDMGILDKEPADDQILTTRFVPVKP